MSHDEPTCTKPGEIEKHGCRRNAVRGVGEHGVAPVEVWGGALSAVWSEAVAWGEEAAGSCHSPSGPPSQRTYLHAHREMKGDDGRWREMKLARRASARTGRGLRGGR